MNSLALSCQSLKALLPYLMGCWMGGVSSSSCSNFWNQGLKMANFSDSGVSDIFLETIAWVFKLLLSVDRIGNRGIPGEWVFAGIR